MPAPTTGSRTRAAKALYLAIDQGGQGSRVLVFNGRGEVRVEASRPCAVQHPAPQCVEHDPEELLGSVREALREALQALGRRRAAIAGAGLATQRSSIVCWDRTSGQALSPVLSWQDTRAHEWLAGFAAHAEELHARTGLRLSAHYGASKLRWCLDRLEAVRAAQARGRLAWGPVASFLLFHLLEERPLLVDPANASRTLLWNLHTRDWDPELLALFDLPRAPLPTCTPSIHRFGTLAGPGATLELRVVTGDQSAALYACGRPQQEVAYINIGTGAFLQRLCRARPDRAWPFLASVVLQEDTRVTYALEATVNGAASALRWLEREHGVRDPELRLEDWFAQVRSPPLFMNGISGLGSPYWVADFRSHFVGAGGPAAKAVAVAESVVFLLVDNLEQMRERAPPAQAIRISGGLARVDALCQRLADASGLAVERPGECEASARGLAYLLAGAPKRWPPPAGERRFAPVPDPALRERYQRWRAALRSALAG